MTEKNTEKLHTELETIVMTVTKAFTLLTHAGKYQNKSAMHIEELRTEIEQRSEYSSHHQTDSSGSLAPKPHNTQNGVTTLDLSRLDHCAAITQPESQVINSDGYDFREKTVPDTYAAESVSNSSSSPRPMGQNDRAFVFSQSTKRKYENEEDYRSHS